MRRRGTAAALLTAVHTTGHSPQAVSPSAARKSGVALAHREWTVATLGIPRIDAWWAERKARGEKLDAWTCTTS